MSRVIKQGQLNQEKLQEAIINAPTIEVGKFEWTITDVVDGRGFIFPFIFGKLTKYSKDGRVTIIDEPAKQQLSAVAQNLMEASSPFVYLPQFSGLAYLHVWNGIQEDVFPKRFKSIIEAAYGNFFVNCVIEPVADYRAFYERLKSLSRITELSARVYPPNPMFGRLWASLDQYVKQRKADEVSVRETSEKPEGINTKLISIIEKLLDNPKFEPEKEPDITDAAILMAADGYGSGKAIGYEGETEAIVRTSETQKSFLQKKDPYPEELAKSALANFKRVSNERNMGH